MTHHPMVPTNEQFKKWEDLWFEENENIDVLLIDAYQAGADAELDACCEWLRSAGHPPLTISVLHAGRRPKPPSLAEQGMESLSKVIETLKILLPNGTIGGVHIENIQKCLEQLKQLEGETK